MDMTTPTLKDAEYHGNVLVTEGDESSLWMETYSSAGGWSNDEAACAAANAVVLAEREKAGQR